MTRHLELTLRDPIIARDGRPFSLGERMKSLDWPYPSVLAGSLRSLLGKQAGGEFTEDMVEKLQAIAVAGPLPARRGVLYFPAPADLVVRDDGGVRTPFVLRPQALGAEEGVDFPVEGLQPVLPTDPPEKDFKPGKLPAFWSLGKIEEWLGRAEPPEGWEAPPAPGRGGCGYLDTPEQDARTHAKIRPDTGAHEEGMLFRTVGLAPAGEVTLSARVQAHNAFSTRLGVLSTLHPFGGERRLVHWQSKAQGPDGWSCPPSLVEALTKTPYLRMVLATPAVFKGGWKPGWLGDGLNGTPPVAGAPPMRLVGACLDRWRPISGWDMRVRARKGIRRLVPAGGVYFFRADAQLTADVARRLWLQPVCDEPQDQRDGFGLALWGVGQPTEGGE